MYYVLCTMYYVLSRIFGRDRTSQGEVLAHTTLGVDFLIDAPTPG